LAKYLSEEYFAQVLAALSQDQKWAETTKNFKTTIAINVTDMGQNYLLGVDNGTTTLQKVTPGTGAEFSLDGTYESWCKVAKGEVDLQSAVLKGQLRFKGSLTKVLMYRDKLTRVADIMKDTPKEF